MPVIPKFDDIPVPGSQIRMPNLGQKTLDEIKRKAGLGLNLVNPTPEKQSVWNHYATGGKAPVYVGSDYQKGWGVGWSGGGDVTGGFKGYNDPTSLQNEIARMQQVITNRQKFGLDNVQENNYFTKLNSMYSPYKPVDVDKYKSETATIEDLAKKYGFDYSREYAKRQAEAEAQAKRNAVEDAKRKNASNRDVNLKAIDNNVMGAADALDRNYFQKYMSQAQDQVNNGLNGGLAADQDLRLAMARQAALGDVYRDANLGKMKENERFTNDDLRLAEEMGLIDQSALAREDSLFNDRLNQAFAQIQQLNDFNLRENSMLLDAEMSQRGQNIGMNQFSQQLQEQRGQWLKEFERQLNRDKVGDSQWNKQFNYQAGRDKIGDSQWNKQFGLQKDQMSLDKEKFRSDAEWRRYTFNNMSASEKEEMAWRFYDLSKRQELERESMEFQAGASGSFLAP